MTTKKAIVERVLTTLRQSSKDRGMSKRYVLHILEEKMKFLIAQKLRERSLYRTENLYTTIDCFEFEEVDTVKCEVIEFRLCKSIMKSKHKVPELIYSKYGDSVKMLSSLDYGTQIAKTNLSEYLRNKGRKGYQNKPLFYVKDDGYVYVVNSKIEVATLQVLTTDTKTATESSCEQADKCKPALEYTFTGTDKLSEVVVQQTLQEILGSYMQVRPDENPDKNENVL